MPKKCLKKLKISHFSLIKMTFYQENENQNGNIYISILNIGSGFEKRVFLRISSGFQKVGGAKKGFGFSFSF